jgi:hypothetical protein
LFTRNASFICEGNKGKLRHKLSGHATVCSPSAELQTKHSVENTY